MMRRMIVVAAVITLVLVSGCSGFADSDGPESPETLTATQVGEDVITVNNYDSYTIEWSETFSSGNRSQSIVGLHAKVDSVSQRGYVQSRTARDNLTRFTTGDTTYIRFLAESPTGTRVQYDRAEAPYDGVYAPVTNETINKEEFGLNISRWLNVSLSRTGSEEYNGQTVTVYEKSRSEGEFRPPRSYLNSPGVTWQQKHITVYRNQNGEVVHLNITYTGENRVSGENEQTRFEFVFSVTDLDRTSVEEPEWLDIARNQTTN